MCRGFFFSFSRPVNHNLNHLGHQIYCSAPSWDEPPHLYQHFVTCQPCLVWQKGRSPLFCCCHLYLAQWRPPATKCSPFLNFTANASMNPLAWPCCHSRGFNWYSFGCLPCALQAVRPAVWGCLTLVRACQIKVLFIRGGGCTRARKVRGKGVWVLVFCSPQHIAHLLPLIQLWV